MRVHEDQQSEFGDHRKCKGKVLFTHTEKNFFSSRTKDSISLRRADIDQKTQTQICSFPKILNTIRDTIHLSLYDPATGLPAERRMVGYSLHSSSWLFLVWLTEIQLLGEQSPCRHRVHSHVTATWAPNHLARWEAHWMLRQPGSQSMVLTALDTSDDDGYWGDAFLFPRKQLQLWVCAWARL